MTTKFTMLFTMILACTGLFAQTAYVSNQTEFLNALGNNTINRIELTSDITLSISFRVDRTLTISGGASNAFTITITNGEVEIRHQTNPAIKVTLEDLGLSMHNPDVQRPYGIKHMTGELIANNLTIDLQCGDGGFQPGLAPAGIYVHVGTKSTIDGSLIKIDNDYTGATYGVYFTAEGDHSVTNTEFFLTSLGTYRFAFGTQNVTGPVGGPFTLANFSNLVLTGNSSTGATHCMMVYLLDSNSAPQMYQAKTIIDYVINRNGGVTKSKGLPRIGQIRSEGGIIEDYPPVPVPLAGWSVFLIAGLVLVFWLIRIRAF